MPLPAAPCVATLIAAGPAGLPPDLAAALAARLPEAGPIVWLDPGRAADLPFAADPTSLAARRDDLLAAAGSARLDVFVQPMAGRSKSLFLADMDSTMIGQECIDELADYCGIKPEVAAITERAMRGELAFEPALRARVALLKGLPVSVVDEILAERIRPNPGAETLVATLRAEGIYCSLVSGGFTLFTGAVAQRLGFDEHRSNRLEVSEGRLAGTVAEPILGREAKRERLLALREERRLPATATLAVGDGANDLAMLESAGLGVAYRAKPAVAEAARARIDHGDLTALLFLLGIPRSRFVAAG